MRCVSPWYNRTGWLGVKHQLTYVFTTWSFAVKMWYFPISMSRSKNMSVFNSILFTATYDEVSCDNYIVIMCDIGMDPGLYLKSIVLYFWTVSKHIV